MCVGTRASTKTSASTPSSTRTNTRTENRTHPSLSAITETRSRTRTSSSASIHNITGADTSTSTCTHVRTTMNYRTTGNPTPGDNREISKLGDPVLAERPVHNSRQLSTASSVQGQIRHMATIWAHHIRPNGTGTHNIRQPAGP